MDIPEDNCMHTHQEPVHTAVLQGADQVLEPARQLPVAASADVVVAGGGTAGVVAAIAAARSGVSVLLVESSGSLGGTATNGLVTPMMSIQIDGAPMCSSISDDINDRMAALGAGSQRDGTVFFDPEMMGFVLDQLAREAGVQMLRHTLVTGAVMRQGRIVGILTENKRGREAILGKRFIDCTGDGDVCVRAGAGYEAGDPETGRNQPISLRYMMSGVDLKRFAGFLNSLDPQGRYEADHFHTACVWNRKWPLEPIFRQALEAGELTWEDGLYWQVFSVPGRPDTLAFNCPEVFDRVNGTDASDLTHAQMYGREAMLRLSRFYRARLPGFENAFITQVAPQVGVRESRRIHCLYRLSDEDVLLRRKFPDGVAQSNYPIDIHGLDLMNRELGEAQADVNPWYEVPYRAMVVADVENLLVAGRCVDASFAAQATLRVQPTVRALGEAAGIAAALSIQQDVSPARLEGAVVRQEMLRRGARFADGAMMTMQGRNSFG